MSMIRVSRRRPCPICDRPDWCLVAADGSAAICQRIESDHRVGDAGHLHRLRDDWTPPPRRVVRRSSPRQTIDWAARHERYRRHLTDAGRDHVAQTLGITSTTVDEMAIGWCPSRSVYTWPLCDGHGRIVGIRTRADHGPKRADTGSDGSGLIYGPDLSARYLLVAEGPTDTTALADCGYPSVVGLPSCRSGTRYIIDLIRRLRPSAVVLVPDRDDAGLSGFASVAGSIIDSGAIPLIRIDAVVPPHDAPDARAWAKKNRQDLTKTMAESIARIKQRSNGGTTE